MSSMFTANGVLPLSVESSKLKVCFGPTERTINKLPLPSSNTSCLTPSYECQSWDLGQAHQADCHAPAAGCAAPDRVVVSAAHPAQRKNAQGQHDLGCRGQKRGRKSKATEGFHRRYARSQDGRKAGAREIKLRQNRRNHHPLRTACDQHHFPRVAEVI